MERYFWLISSFIDLQDLFLYNPWELIISRKSMNLNEQKLEFLLKVIEEVIRNKCLEISRIKAGLADLSNKETTIKKIKGEIEAFRTLRKLFWYLTTSDSLDGRFSDEYYAELHFYPLDGQRRREIGIEFIINLIFREDKKSHLGAFITNEELNHFYENYVFPWEYDRSLANILLSGFGGLSIGLMGGQ